MLYKVLFVCTGNTCRSPLARAIFMNMVQTRGLDGLISAESAGTTVWRDGMRPDSRAVKVARANGLSLEETIRAFLLCDFNRFDLIVPVDQTNYELLKKLGTQNLMKKVRLLREFDGEAGKNRNIPDPVRGGRRRFQETFQLLEKCCEGLLAYLQRTAAV